MGRDSTPTTNDCPEAISEAESRLMRPIQVMGQGLPVGPWAQGPCLRSAFGTCLEPQGL